MKAAKNVKPFVPPVFLVNTALRLRRTLIRMADSVVPAYLPIYDRFMGAAMTSLIHSAANLRIADQLKDGPLAISELSKRTNTSPEMLERMMRALISINVFRQLPDKSFANNYVSSSLVTGTSGNIRGFAEFFGKESIIQAWNDLPNTLRDGKTSFERVHGQSVWDWMSNDTGALHSFVEGMSSITEGDAPAIAAKYPFHEVKTICDVGGGVGIVLAAVLNQHPHLEGILFDSKQMLDKAGHHLSSKGISHRVKLHEGNFFESIPRGAEAYILKYVLHNWNDENAAKILTNCRKAMDPGHRLLVSDFHYESDSPSTLVPFMDMAGMMIYSGRERTRDCMAQLFTQTGFSLNRVIPLPGCQAIFEGIAVG